jgi:hypothetical protein
MKYGGPSCCKLFFSLLQTCSTSLGYLSFPFSFFLAGLVSGTTFMQIGEHSIKSEQISQREMKQDWKRKRKLGNSFRTQMIVRKIYCKNGPGLKVHLTHEAKSSLLARLVLLHVRHIYHILCHFLIIVIWLIKG